ncbi:MAG: nucleotide exchange factor GrpE [Actinomycetales bacterium]|nr:nucleotide exchange factor GrpE [Actinomycetales bacterium]
MTDQEFEEQRVRVTDKRRVDPDTFEVRQQEAEEAPADALEGDLADVDVKVAELTADLQRVHAEYANYRKRVERDRELMRTNAIGGVLAELLSVLDDIERARQHDELDGAFKAVGESLESTVQRIGLEKFGAEGEPFDPNIHEALTHQESDEVSEPTVVAVYQPGYRYAERVLRPARVAVAGTN